MIAGGFVPAGLAGVKAGACSAQQRTVRAALKITVGGQRDHIRPHLLLTNWKDVNFHAPLLTTIDQPNALPSELGDSIDPDGCLDTQRHYREWGRGSQRQGAHGFVFNIIANEATPFESIRTGGRAGCTRCVNPNIDPLPYVGPSTLG
jgi:hypothetical protein